jgi:chorismate mutase
VHNVCRLSKEQRMESDPIKFVWKLIKEHLEKERHRIYDEIRNYPPPIPACDAQFNHLLEERRGVSQELAQLEQLSRQDLTPEQHRQSIDQFISSSSYVNHDAARTIRSRLKEQLSGLE